MFWNKKAAPARSASADPNASILKRFANMALGKTTYAAGQKAERAMDHIVVYRCLDKIGLTMQGVRWYVERDPDVPKSFRTNEKTVAALEAMFQAPNSDLNAAFMRYWMAITYAAFGRVPLKAGTNADGIPNALYTLDPRLTEPKRSASGEIFEFTYGNGADAIRIPSRHKARKNANGDPTEGFAFEIRKPTLSGQIGSKVNTPLNAIGLPAEVVTLLLQRAWDTASGHPNSKYIIGVDKTLTEPQKKTLQEAVESRTVDHEESGNVLILGNTSVQVHKLDNNLADIHSKMPLDDMSRHIAGAFGIPVALLGFSGADGSKFANNYTESRRSFYEDTIIPGYCVPFADGINQGMMPEGYVMRFDLDAIPALQDYRVTRAKELTAVGFLTNDEKRELCGYPKLADGQVLPNTTAPSNTEPSNPPSQ